MGEPVDKPKKDPLIELEEQVAKEVEDKWEKKLKPKPEEKTKKKTLSL